MGKSKIEWTDETWNPITGCTKVSAGCKHCYAERYAQRRVGDFRKYDPNRYPENDRRFIDVLMHDDRLDQPLHWRRPRKVFVCSMSDLFHEYVPGEFLERVFETMLEATHHTYQILTKRPERMREYLRSYEGEFSQAEHIWLGVSVEDQDAADTRIPLLLQTPAAVRFVSVEPMLSRVELGSWVSSRDEIHWRDSQPGDRWTNVAPGIHWVICGGESGPQARPMHPDWARSLRDQCQAAGVPFFFKQWGEWEPVAPIYDSDAYEDRLSMAHGGRCITLDRSGVQWPEFQPPGGSWLMERIGKHRAGHFLDGCDWRQFPNGKR